MAEELTSEQREAINAELDAIQEHLDHIDAMLTLLLKLRGVAPPGKRQQRRRLPT